MAVKQNITDTTRDWKLYLNGVEYNHGLLPDYYATVNRNWRAYNLQLYDSLNTKGLPKVKIPMAQRIVRHSVSSCMTKAVTMNFVVENISDSTEDQGEMMQKEIAAYLSQNSRNRWEKMKMDSMIRELLLNGANEGDYATHTYWDSTYDTGQTRGIEIQGEDGQLVLDAEGMPTYQSVTIMGEFFTEIVDGGNVFFGNPNDRRVQTQPYIIVSGRDMVAKLRKEANLFTKENGLTKDDIDQKIVADIDYEEQVGDRGQNELGGKDDETGKATYIIKYWLGDDGKLCFNKSVKSCFIRKDVKTNRRLYPITFGNWDIIKNSYHGQALMTGLIENQMELDKAYAKLFKYLSDMAFPMAIYNKAYLPGGLSTKIGATIGYEAGDNVKPSDVVFYTQPGQIANGVLDIIGIFQSKTMEMLGASDAALGNAIPENTSALVAMTQNAAVPMETVKAYLYQTIEDLGYIWLDFMLYQYEVPRQITIEQNGVRQMVEFDPALLSDAKMTIKVDIIPGGFMDEFNIVRTMESLFDRQIADAVDLISRIPGNVLPEKEKLLEKAKQKQIQLEQMQSQQFKLQAVQEFVQGAQGQSAPTQQPINR